MSIPAESIDNKQQIIDQAIRLLFGKVLNHAATSRLASLLVDFCESNNQRLCPLDALENLYVTMSDIEWEKVCASGKSCKDCQGLEQTKTIQPSPSGTLPLAASV